MSRRCLEKGAEVADRRWRWDRSKTFDASLMAERLVSGWKAMLSSLALMLLGISLYTGRLDLEVHHLGLLLLIAGAAAVLLIVVMSASSSMVDKGCDSCER